MREGLRLAAEDPGTPVILETDNSSVCASLKNQKDRGPLHFIFEEARQAGGLVSEWKTVHTRREGNCVAYELAQLALRSDSELSGFLQCWFVSSKLLLKIVTMFLSNKKPFFFSQKKREKIQHIIRSATSTVQEIKSQNARQLMCINRWQIKSQSI